MDAKRFDAFTRKFLEIGWDRRRLVAALGTGVLSALAPLGLDRITWGKKKNKNKNKKKKGNKNGKNSPLPPPAPPVSPPPPCAPNCAGKDCGHDGCGSSCGSCGNGEACEGGQCVVSPCSPPCTGNHLCQNGTCICPAGLNECDGPGHFGNCHECCVDGSGSVPDAECTGNPGGQFCRDDDGDLVYRCGCPAGQRTCGNGVCVECCEHENCIQKFNDPHRICVGGTCPCNEAAGFFECPLSAGAHPGKCRPIFEDDEACGPQCTVCIPPLAACGGGTCCVPRGGDCSNHFFQCCSGAQCVNVGTVGQPNLVCS